MAVGVIGQHLFEDEMLDLHQCPAGGDIVGINEIFDAEGAFDFGILADQSRPQRRDCVVASKALPKRVEWTCEMWLAWARRRHRFLPGRTGDKSNRSVACKPHHSSA
ncbi:hypothetical protein D3C87_1880400 [compost metagenome]